jgi:type IV pilus assembly protein PilW
VEILVALAVGLFLTAGVVQIYTGSKQTYRVSDAAARLQENGRVAMELLARDIRRSGYLGCAGTAREIDTNFVPPGFFTDFDTPIEGFEATGASAWDRNPAAMGATGATTPPLGGRDVLTIRGAFGEGLAITAIPEPAKFQLSANPNFDDNAVASSCSRAWTFAISSVSGDVVTPDGSTSSLVALFNPATAPSSELLPIDTRSFYIADNTAGVPSLYRRIDNENARELIEGVEDMQVLYGVDSSGDRAANSFLRANDVADWTSVVSARICLVLRSVDEGYPDAAPASCDGSRAVIAGKHLRRLYTATIGLRNQLP